MKNTTQQIIKLYEEVKTIHPSYAEIAKKMKLSKSRVYYVVQRYLKATNATTSESSHKKN